jgi:hypothetical protein
MARNSNTHTVAIATWAPPYSLPTSGQVVAIGTTVGATSFYGTAPTSPTNGTMSGANWSYAVFNNYGGGDVIESYSQGGAYAVACSGGHGVPANVGASIFDFTDAAWKRKDPAATHGGLTYYRTADYSTGETSGSPFPYNINGSNGIPAPCHTQTQQCQVPASVDGSALGSMIQIGRVAMCTESVSSGYIHKFDLSTGIHTRVTSTALANTQVHASAIFDSTRSRWWFCSGEENIRNSLQYLDASDWTIKTTTPTFPFVYNAHYQGSLFMHQGLLCRFGTDLGIYIFDPDNVAAGWVKPPVTGTAPSGYLNRWAYYPPNGKFYYRSSTSTSAVINRLTPPSSSPKTNTWTFDTVTLGSSMPRTTLDGDPGDSAEHYTCLVYVPSIQRLAWIPGGNALVYLIHPGA